LINLQSAVYGLNEGRDFSLPFDVDEYKSLNLDLIAAGLNNSQLLQHFELNGLNEGRASSNDFNISYYLSNNLDLVAAGFNFKQAYDHFVAYGYNEGRVGIAPPTQQWIRELAENTSSDVAVDGTGNVYLTGETYVSGGLDSEDSDAWVAKYDSSGNQQWIQQFGSSNREFNPHLAVDGAGNVYITGSTNGSLEGTNAGGFDAWVAKYNSSGNQQWIQQFGRSGDDFSNELAVDTAGNVYITGVIYSTTGHQLSQDGDGFLAKYNTSGNRRWIRQPSTFSNSSYNDVAVSSDGNIYTVG
jgi:hypothetical protein